MSEVVGSHESLAYEAAEDRGDFHAWRFLWDRKGVILLGIVVGLGLGGLYFTGAEPVYESEATMLMIEVRPAASGGAPSYTSTADTHEAVIRSPMLVGRAVEEHGLGSLPSLRSRSNPAGTIIANLSVESTDNTRNNQHVVRVAYRGKDPDDCAKILEAVTDTYQRFLGDTYQYLAGEAFSLITEAKDVLHRQLMEKEAEYRAFRSDSPLLWRGGEGANLHEARMAQIEQARTALLVEDSQVKARIDAIRKALEQGGSREALVLLIGHSDPEAQDRRFRTTFEQQLFTTLLEEQMLLESYGPDHPQVQAQRKKMRLIRERITGMPEALEGAEEPADFLAVYLESLRQEVKTNEERLEELNRLFEAERRAARSMVSFEIREDTFRSEIARMQQLFDLVIRRLEEISLVKDYNGVETTLLSTPSAGRQVAPQLLRILAAGGMLGLLAGLGLAYLVELADQRFRSPDDITQELRIPILAHVPALTAAAPSNGNGSSGLDPILCTYHHGKGREAEAYRAVRTSVYFGGEGDTLKVIQVTSPDPSDGKTTLAANLAVSVAQSGKRVLLVDADLRRPTLHKLFDLEGETGLSAVMAGRADVLEVIRETPVDNLWVVPSGRPPHNPADLLASRRFEEFLQVVREQYDVVIVDTPPLLAVTDPSAIAPRADGVILVARLTRHARAGLVRSAEMLASVGGHALGVVINGTDGNRRFGYRGYRYNGYRYSGYQYGYGNGNGNGAHHVYYSEQDE